MAPAPQLRAGTSLFLLPERELLVRYTQPLMHDRARGRVLQELFLLRVQVMLNREGRERGCMEARQDELLLTRIGVDIAYGKHAGQIRLKLFGIHLEGFLLELQAPLGDRAELGMQPEEPEQMMGPQGVSRAIARLDVASAQTAVVDNERMG